MSEQVPSNTLLDRLRRAEAEHCRQRSLESSLLGEAANEIQSLEHRLSVAYNLKHELNEELNTLRRANRASNEPPDECDGCEQYAVMHAEIALALDIHDETDAHGLQELILKKLRAAQPPIPAPKFKVGETVWGACAEREVLSIHYRYRVTKTVLEGCGYTYMDESALEPHSSETKESAR